MWKKILIGTSAVLVLLIVSAGMFLHYLLDEACRNQIFSEIDAPGSKYTAITFQRDCGATTGFSTQISILKHGEGLDNNSGNIYIVNGHPKNVAPEVKWVDDKELVIKTELNGNEFKAEKSWGMFDPIRITYYANGS